MDQADILRTIIAALSLTAPVLIVILNHHNRHHLSWGDVLTRVGLGAVFIGIAYGAVEASLDGLGLYTRLYVLTGALVWVNTGLLVSIAHDRSYRRRYKEEPQKKGLRYPW
jgi:hypothetical protein